jgi:hypothetical protein
VETRTDFDASRDAARSASSRDHLGFVTTSSRAAGHDTPTMAQAGVIVLD